MRKKDYIYKHLSDYKINDLKILQNGTWRNKEYSHILPNGNEKLNLINLYSNDISKYIIDNDLKLHMNYRHLNSSQIMAFNFIIPFIVEKKVDLILDLLGIPQEEVIINKLEEIINKKEGTNFDYFIQLKSRRRIFVEIKYTEDNFGTAKYDTSHENKYNDIYKESLERYITPEYNTAVNILKNYQLMRNISYVDLSKDDLVILLYPRWSNSLDKFAKRFINNMLIDPVKNNMKIIYWEDIISNALNLAGVLENGRLLNLILEFNKKYFDVEMFK